MKTFFNRICIFLMVYIIAVPTFGTIRCEAANAKAVKKAKRAYSAYLERHLPVNIPDSDFYDAAYINSKKNAVNSFVLYDLDKDKIPELITYTPINFRWYILRVKTYKKGKVVNCKFSDGSKAVFNNCAVANGAFCNYICKRGHLHNRYVGYFDTYDEAYSFKKGKLNYVTKTINPHKEKTSIKPRNNTKSNRAKLR